MEEEQIVSMDEQQQEHQQQLWDPNKDIPIEPVGAWIKKDHFTEGKVVTITNLGKNNFGKPFIALKEGDNEYQLNINMTFRNQLVRLLGSKLSEWSKQPVKLTSAQEEYEIDGNIVQGYSMYVEKA